MAMGFSFGMVSLSGGYIVAAAGYRTLFALGSVLSVAAAMLMGVVLGRLEGRASSNA
jgi:hypothetical protein